MNLPLSLSDISLWLAVTAVILLVTSELLYSSPKYSMRLLVERRNLRFAALGCGLAFMVTVGMRVFGTF